jgi:hypothetical protein
VNVATVAATGIAGSYPFSARLAPAQLHSKAARVLPRSPKCSKSGAIRGLAVGSGLAMPNSPEIHACRRASPTAALPPDRPKFAPLTDLLLEPSHRRPALRASHLRKRLPRGHINLLHALAGLRSCGLGRGQLRAAETEQLFFSGSLRDAVPRRAVFDLPAYVGGVVCPTGPA